MGLADGMYEYVVWIYLAKRKRQGTGYSKQAEELRKRLQKRGNFLKSPAITVC